MSKFKDCNVVLHSNFKYSILTTNYIIAAHWATKVLRHLSTLDTFHPSPSSTLSPPPETMLDLVSARLASFLHNVELGEGVVHNLQGI